MTRTKADPLPSGDSDEDAASPADAAHGSTPSERRSGGVREPLSYLHAMSAQGARGLGPDQRDGEISGLDTTPDNLRQDDAAEPPDRTPPQPGSRLGTVSSPEAMPPHMLAPGSPLLTAEMLQAIVREPDPAPAGKRYETDLKQDGVTYHVQTEDRGPDKAKVETLVYVGGTILHAKRGRYPEVSHADGLQEAVAKLMAEQHQHVLREVRAGKFRHRLEPRPPTLP